MILNAKKGKKIYLISLLILTILVSIWVIKNIYSLIQSEFIAQDYAAFWTSGRLLLTANNPYSSEKLLDLQQSIGWTRQNPLIPYYPPWAIPFILPFCIKNYILGKFFWLLFNAALVVLCIDFSLRIYGHFNKRMLLIFVAFTFSPIIFTLMQGQNTPLILFGVVAFLYFDKKKQYFLAGSVTILIATKPHTVYLFWLVLLLWVLDRRRWYVLVSGGLFFLIFTALSLHYNHNIINHYLNLMSNSPASSWLTPTIGTYLRLFFGMENNWLQFMPPVFGTIWLFWYWRKHKKTWEWDQQIPIIIFMSLMTTFYVWVNDYILILPALIQAAISVIHNRQALALNWVIIAYVAVNGLAWAIHIWITPNMQWDIWLVPSLFLIYLTLRKQLNHLSLTIIKNA
jgi:hypothetical protein